MNHEATNKGLKAIHIWSYHSLSQHSQKTSSRIYNSIILNHPSSRNTNQLCGPLLSKNKYHTPLKTGGFLKPLSQASTHPPERSCTGDDPWPLMGRLFCLQKPNGVFLCWCLSVLVSVLMFFFVFFRIFLGGGDVVLVLIFCIRGA